MTDNGLTLAAFIALITLLLGVAGAVVSVMSRVSGLSKRIAKIEARYEAHVRNGERHH